MIYFKITILLIIGCFWYWAIETKITDYQFYKSFSHSNKNPLLEALKTHPIDITGFIITNLILMGVYNLL